MEDKALKEQSEQCAKEIEETLKKYDCSLHVIFNQEVVIGNTALIYKVSIEPNKAK